MSAIHFVYNTSRIIGGTYFVLLIDRAHKCSCRWQDFVDEDKDGFLRRELDALADDIDELTNSEVCGDKVFLLVDGSNVRFLHLLTDHLNADSNISFMYC